MKSPAKADVVTRVLKRYPGLSGPAPSLHEFLAQATIVQIPAGTVVFKKGDPCENFLLLLDGTLRVQVSSDHGRELTLYRMLPGQSCAITTACLFRGDPYPAEAVAERELRGVVMPRAEFEAALVGSEGFRRFIFDGFARRMNDVVARIESVVLRSVDERLAEVLLASHDQVLPGLSQRQIAADIGTAREVVSRRLKALAEQGLIHVNRGSIRIVEAEGLRALCRHPE